MFELTKISDKTFNFTYKTESGQVLLTGELYGSKEAARQAVELTKKHAADENRYERSTSKDGKFYFCIKTPNGEILGTSPLFSSESGMENGILSVTRKAPGGEVTEE